MKSLSAPFNFTAAGAALAIAAVLSGCASPLPTAQVTPPNIPSASHTIIDQNDQVFVKVVPTKGLIMLPADLQRLEQVVKTTIDDKRRLNGPGANVEAYDIEVTITRYDKGSSVRRAVAAALGQMRIEAHVVARTSLFEQTVNEFNTAKTSDGSSADGVVDNIADIEPAFAAGLAAGLTGQ